MSEVWEWFQQNQAAMVALAMIVGGLIVKATPTQKDDEWWEKLKGLFRKSG